MRDKTKESPLERGLALTVEKGMTKGVITLFEDDTVQEAICTLLDHNISGVPIVDFEGRLKGVVTEKDLLLCTDTEDPVGKYMTCDVVWTTADTSIEEVAKTFHSNNIKRLPVLDGEGIVIGIISRRDVLQVKFGA